MLESPGEVAAKVGEVVDAIWLASAMASVLDRGAGGPFDADDPAARVLAAFGLMEGDGARWTAAPAFVDMTRGRAAAFAAGLRSTLGQAATAAFQRGDPGGWSGFGDDILIAQGEASAMVGRVLAATALATLDGLSQRFERGGTFLDVGVGVAGLACAFGAAVPGAHVVGLDPLPRAIDLAAKNVADQGLSGRVELRPHGVEQLDERRHFDLAFVAVPFIPPGVVADGLHRVHRVLDDGAWLVLPGAVSESGAAGAIARWQTHVAGGTLFTEAQRAEVLDAAGFGAARALPVPPGCPALVGARKC